MAIQSITVQAGQKIYIPRNATVVGKFFSGSATADSECIELDDIEDLECYIFILAGNDEDGTQSQFLEPGRGAIYGIKLGTVTQTFDDIEVDNARDGGYDGEAIIAKLTSSSLTKDVIYSPAESHRTLAGRGTLTYICFRTLKTVADQLYLLQKMSAPMGDGANEFSYVQVAPILLSKAVEDNYLSLCSCQGEELED